MAGSGMIIGGALGASADIEPSRLLFIIVPVPGGSRTCFFLALFGCFSIHPRRYTSQKAILHVWKSCTGARCFLLGQFGESLRPTQRRFCRGFRWTDSYGHVGRAWGCGAAGGIRLGAQPPDMHDLDKLLVRQARTLLQEAAAFPLLVANLLAEALFLPPQLLRITPQSCDLVRFAIGSHNWDERRDEAGGVICGEVLVT